MPERAFGSEQLIVTIASGICELLISEFVTAVGGFSVRAVRAVAIIDQKNESSVFQEAK